MEHSSPELDEDAEAADRYASRFHGREPAKALAPTPWADVRCPHCRRLLFRERGFRVGAVQVKCKCKRVVEEARGT